MVYTPERVPLCGHATLATAYALDYRGDWQGETLTFETASGEIYVKRRMNGLSIEFPSVPMIEIEKVAAVEQALGVTVISMHQPEEGAWQMVCELGSQAEVEAVLPTMWLWPMPRHSALPLPPREIALTLYPVLYPAVGYQ